MKKAELFDWKYLNEREFVVVDIETSGYSYEKGARIIEIGAVKFKDGEIIDEFSTFVNPQLKISNEITNLTGITNEHVKGAPLIVQVLPEFKKFIGDLLVVAHNADFDWNRFLTPCFKLAGVNANNRVLDTLVLSKRTFPNEKKHNLAIMCERLGVEVEGHHRAINDVKMTGYAYLKMIELNKTNIPEEDAQISLFEESIQPKEIFNPEIKRVSYWERANSKRVLYSRHYVVLRNGKYYGNVFYDILTGTWNNKDYNGNIDFNIVEQKVLNFLRLKSISEFKAYRN